MVCNFVKFMFLIIVPIIHANDVCLTSENSNCSDPKVSKYSKEANTNHLKYSKDYTTTKENYAPCDNTKCSCHTSVISDDLKIFNKGISKQMLDNIKSKGTKYQIIDHRLYRDKNCMFPARCDGIEHFLLKLSSKLPDTEFIINTRDWPQIHNNYGLFGPVFSFSKTKDYHDIMYPAWAFWEGGPAISLYPKGIGRWDIHRNLLGKIGNNTTWDTKISKGFFRGSRTSSERDPLVLLSRERPELVDAQYTKNQAWKSDADTLHQPPASEVSFEEHCKYKYLFNFRGVAASFRFKHILLCKSVVFHVGNEWLEFFYPSLKPWIHYVPVEPNASKEKLEELLKFVMDNDDVAQEVAQNGYNMIWNNLKMVDVFCYWRKLLKKYTALLTYKPILEEDLIEIKD